MKIRTRGDFAMDSSGVATALAHAVGEISQSLVSTAPCAKKDPVPCDVCGNECEAPLEIRVRGRVATFDCFECAIHLLAPTCERCGCRIIGHGVDAGGSLYCSSHCAHAAKRS
jgi:hypothetical protein